MPHEKLATRTGYTSDEEAIIKEALRLVSRAKDFRVLIEHPDEAKDMFHLMIGGSNIEYFAAAFMSGTELIEARILYEGTREAVSVNLSEFIRTVVGTCADGVIISHNHPGGRSEFSDDDIDLTLELARLCGAVNVVLLDHILVADEVISMEELDMLSPSVLE